MRVFVLCSQSSKAVYGKLQGFRVHFFGFWIVGGVFG